MRVHSVQSSLLKRPDRGNGKLERITVGVAEVDRGRRPPERQFCFNRDMVRGEALAPSREFAGFDAERGVTRAGCAVRRERSAFTGLLGAKQQEGARAGSHLKCGPAMILELDHQAEPEYVAIERDRAIKVADVQRGFEDGKRRGHSKNPTPASRRHSINYSIETGPFTVDMRTSAMPLPQSTP